jgi:hypothetical protein
MILQVLVPEGFLSKVSIVVCIIAILLVFDTIILNNLFVVTLFGIVNYY